MGFDQLMLLYEHYTVTNAKVTASFFNDESKQSGFVGISIAPDASLSSTFQAVMENGLLAKSWIGCQSDGTQNSRSFVQVSMPIDIKQINGVVAPIVGDDLYRGAADSNPTEQTYIALWACNPYDANVMNLFVTVDIEFDAVFTEPRKLTQS